MAYNLNIPPSQEPVQAKIVERRYSSELDNSVPHKNSEIEYSFICDRGTEEIQIHDELITNQAVAQARAESIFLEKSYIESTVTFTTYHLDGVQVGVVVEVDNKNYKVVDAETSISGAKVTLQVTAKRWD